MEAAPGSAGSRLALPGIGQHPGSSALMAPLLSLVQSGEGSLSRMPSQDEIQASLQREPSTERRMGRISLAQSLDLLQQQ
jgi:hypothetical protein